MNYRAAATSNLKNTDSGLDVNAPKINRFASNKSNPDSYFKPSTPVPSEFKRTPSNEKSSKSAPDSTKQKQKNRLSQNDPKFKKPKDPKKKPGNSFPDQPALDQKRISKIELETTLANSIGSCVEVKYTDGRTTIGKVFCYDQSTEILVLMNHANSNINSRQNGFKNDSNPNNDLSFMQDSRKKAKAVLINAINIVDISLLENSSSDSCHPANFNLPEVKPLPIDLLKVAHNKVLENARASSLLIGVGVTREAQCIFDALNKTLPCRWIGTKISVLDEIIIEPPYDISNCKSLNSTSESLDRVKKVIVCCEISDGTENWCNGIMSRNTGDRDNQYTYTDGSNRNFNLSKNSLYRREIDAKGSIPSPFNSVNSSAQFNDNVHRQIGINSNFERPWVKDRVLSHSDNYNSQRYNHLQFSSPHHNSVNIPNRSANPSSRSGFSQGFDVNEPNFQNRLNYSNNSENQFSSYSSRFMDSDRSSNNYGFNNINGYSYQENSRATNTNSDSSQLPTFLLNTAMGKSPTNNKIHLNFNQQKQISPFASRSYAQKRSTTPEGFFIPSSKRINNYGPSDFSHSPHVNNDETPPVLTLDDDEMLSNRQNNEVFDDSSFDKAPGANNSSSPNTEEQYFDDDWEVNEVIDQSLLVFGTSRDNVNFVSEHFEKYGKIKAILGAPDLGNWFVIVYEYPESSNRAVMVSNENGGKILINEGRILVGAEKAGLEAISIAKAEQIHLYPKKVVKKSYHSFQKSNSHATPQENSFSFGLRNSNSSVRQNTINMNNYDSLNDSARISLRKKPRRLGPNPPRRLSTRPQINDNLNLSLNSENSTPRTPQFRLPFANSPSVISTISSNTPIRNISGNTDENRTSNKLQKNNLQHITSNNVTPLNIRPRSGFLQTAVDMLFGW
ncbi:Protein LSM12-like protein [Smittium culicis]|uniref:Protein LSM12-like protein n=1 Tax=Smittium culicis TaxID=133412 RepID=A0A1R1XU23_9FUNG|nr:Protein LSM12-like protein [Smittium culicis]